MPKSWESRDSSSATSELKGAIQHLFNSQGEWVAFRTGKYVFSPDARWVGWLPWEDSEIVDMDGKYLGTIFEGNRVYREIYHKDREYPGYPGYPDTPNLPGYPGFAGPSELPAGTEDVRLSVAQ